MYAEAFDYGILEDNDWSVLGLQSSPCVLRPLVPWRDEQRGPRAHSAPAGRINWITKRNKCALIAPAGLRSQLLISTNQT